MSPITFWNINNGERDRYAAFAEWEARWNPQWLSLLGIRSETVKMNTGTVQGYNATYTDEANAFNAKDRSRTDNNWDMTALARYIPDSSKTYRIRLCAQNPLTQPLRALHLVDRRHGHEHDQHDRGWQRLRRQSRSEAGSRPHAQRHRRLA